MLDVENIRDDFSCFRRSIEGVPLRYLDNAATSQTPDCVRRIVSDYEAQGRSNVKRGSYQIAEEATERFESARQVVSQFIGIHNPDEVIFTSGATAGINMVAASLGDQLREGDEIIISELEHHSNIVPWQLLAQRKKLSLKYLPITADGRVDLEMLSQALSSRTRLVALTHASNVTGAVTDIRSVTDQIHRAGARILLDGAQRIPHGPINLEDLDVDFYVFSGHKVYGPHGIGAMWGKMEFLEDMVPAVGGGEMTLQVTMTESKFLPPPHRFEAGTPPISQAIGLGAALCWFQSQDIDGINQHLNNLIQKTIQGLNRLSEEISTIRILGPSPDAERLPLVSFAVENAHSHDICQIMADEFNVCLRGGDHCAQPAHTALNIPESVRISLAAYNTEEEIDTFLEGLAESLKILV